jgi:hypothetical protein
VSELETEFEKVKGEKVLPARYLKSQQQKQAKLAAEVAVAGGDGEGEIVTNDKWNYIGHSMIQTAVYDKGLTKEMILRFEVFLYLVS